MYRFKRLVLQSDNRKRIFVTSDIHGHLGHLKAALEKALFSDGDLLIVIGDIVDKGPASLETLRYVMHLCDSGNAVAAIGNVDYRCLYFLYGLENGKVKPLDFLDSMKQLRSWKGTGLFDEMFKEIGNIPESVDELVETLPEIFNRFSAELDFLKNLPTVIETEKYIFVHGGLPYGEDGMYMTPDEDKNAFEYLKADEFLTRCRKEGKSFKKHIVCGHWPVPNYGEKILSANPIIDKTTNIIAADGGCGLIREGQLNMLVLPSLDCEPDAIENIPIDFMPVAIALDYQKESENPFSIGWFGNDVHLLDINGETALIEQITSGKQMEVTVDSLWTDPNALKIGDITKINQSTDYRPEIFPNDVLAVVKILSDRILIKKNGVIGWYYGRIEMK